MKWITFTRIEPLLHTFEKQFKINRLNEGALKVDTMIPLPQITSDDRLAIW